MYRREIGTVLVAGDDAAELRTIAGYFSAHDMPAKAVSSGDDLYRSLGAEEASMVILDLDEGPDRGLDMLQRIRVASSIPVVIATQRRLEEADRTVALEMGADDYMAKPIALRELLARARSILRRQELGRAARMREPVRGGYKFDGWHLEHQGRRLISPQGITVRLTKGEYNLLLAFLEAPQRTLSREQLLQATQVTEDIFDRSVDVQILRLRRKLEPANSSSVIRTERGVGYALAASVEAY
jgi:two-component system, OmpR family, response regulator